VRVFLAVEASRPPARTARPPFTETEHRPLRAAVERREFPPRAVGDGGSAMRLGLLANPPRRLPLRKSLCRRFTGCDLHHAAAQASSSASPSVAWRRTGNDYRPPSIADLLVRHRPSARPFYGSFTGKLFAKSALVVLLCGHFVFRGCVVTHGSVDQEWQGNLGGHDFQRPLTPRAPGRDLDAARDAFWKLSARGEAIAAWDATR